MIGYYIKVHSRILGNYIGEYIEDYYGKYTTN
jgi:hypothetical protein